MLSFSISYLKYHLHKKSLSRFLCKLQKVTCLFYKVGGRIKLPTLILYSFNIITLDMYRLSNLSSYIFKTKLRLNDLRRRLIIELKFEPNP